MAIYAYCSYCGSPDVYVPTEQGTTAIRYCCLKCGKMMEPNLIFKPAIYKVQPDGSYREIG